MCTLSITNKNVKIVHKISRQSPPSNRDRRNLNNCKHDITRTLPIAHPTAVDSEIASHQRHEKSMNEMNNDVISKRTTQAPPDPWSPTYYSTTADNTYTPCTIPTSTTIPAFASGHQDEDKNTFSSLHHQWYIRNPIYHQSSATRTY